jgi:hypothetical protein
MRFFLVSVSIPGKDLPRSHHSSAEHFAEPPDAEHHQDQRKRAQDQKILPQPSETRALDHVGTGNHAEMANRVDPH